MRDCCLDCSKTNSFWNSFNSHLLMRACCFHRGVTALLSAMGDVGLEKQIVFQSLKSRLHLYNDHVAISLLKRTSLRPLNKRGVADNSERRRVSESSDYFDITAAVFSFLPTDATNAFSHLCLIHFLMASDCPISFGVLLLSSCSGSNEKK